MPKRIMLLAGLMLGFAAMATLFAWGRLRSASPPEEIARAFFVETYTHDFEAAWELVSSADQAARSKQEYVAANPKLLPQQAALYEQLAAWGEFEVISLVSGQPDLMTVTARVRFPNSAHPELLELFAQAEAQTVDADQLGEQLARMHQQDQLQFFEGDISINLVREQQGWRVVQHWGNLVTVRLSASVSPNLPWDFYPVESEIQAVPGELVRASYVARNQSDRPITAKAVHEVGPAAVAGYFQTVQCFCFTEQTLEPGQEREMVLLFQIDLGLPPGVALFHNRYVFYTLDEFPAEGSQSAR